jgi:hypothetical protein
MSPYDEIADAMDAEAREQTADGRLSRAAVLQDWAARIRAMAPPARDESVPPPGWRWVAVSPCPIVQAHQNVQPIANIVAPLAEAWAIYDREHGYAPDHARIRALAERWKSEGDAALQDGQWGEHDDMHRMAGELLALLEDKR